MNKKELISVIKTILKEREKSVPRTFTCPMLIYSIPKKNGEEKIIRFYFDDDGKVRIEVMHTNWTLTRRGGMMNPYKTLKDEEIKWLSDNIGNYKK